MNKCYAWVVLTGSRRPIRDDTKGNSPFSQSLAEALTKKQLRLQIAVASGFL